MKEKMPVLPPGLRDVLPVEAQELKSIKDNLSSAFRSWGYKDIQTPAFEYYDLLSSQTGDVITREMFKFFDSNGALLALRPEMTTPIARLVAQRFKNSPLPVRLSYIAEVFRQEKPRQGQQRQFCQAGIELIGSNTDFSDAETIIILIECLKGAGLKDFKVGIGQIDFVNGLIEAVSKDEQKAAELKNLIALKNLVGLEIALRKLNSPLKAKEALLELPSLRGNNIFNVAKKMVINAKSERALENLKKIAGLIKSYGCKEVVYDLGIVRNFDYYTGVIFEAYTPEIGFPVGGGGRYDQLLAGLGTNLPAAGFAIGVERLHIALAEQGVGFKNKEKAVVLFGKGDNSLLKARKSLAEQGYTVYLLSDKTEKQAREFALSRQISILAFLSGDQIKIIKGEK